MKRQISFLGLFLVFLIGGVFPVSGLGVPDGGGATGYGGGSILFTVLPFLLIIGITVLFVLALIRDIRAIKYGNNVSLAIVALILTVLVSPIGIIISFTAVKKVVKPEPKGGNIKPE
jgi:hypothetical protein